MRSRAKYAVSWRTASTSTGCVVVAGAAEPAVARRGTARTRSRSSRRRAPRAQLADRGVHHGPHVSSPSGRRARRQGVPEVQQGVGAPGPPALGERAAAAPGRGRARRARCGRRGRSAGRRRGGRARAARCSRRSTARCRAAPAAPRRTSSRSGPRSSATVAGGQRRAQADQRAAAGARHRQVLGVERRRASRRRGTGGSSPSTSVRDAAGRARATSRAGDGAGAGDADLLAEHRADRDLVAVDVARARAGPGGARTSGPITGSPAKCVVDRDRVAVGVEQPAGALDRGARCRAGRRARTCAGTNAVCPALGASASSSRTVPGPCGRSRVRAYQPSPGDLDARHRRTARKSSSAAPANGVRTASRIVDRARWPRRPPRRPRSSVGRGGVDLADGVVELPDAGEARPRTRRRRSGSSVVSISTRAVCARRARASASGPAPSSAVSSRLRWRGV